MYPHTADVLAAAGLHRLRHYIDKWRNTIWKSVRSRPILEECMGAERQEGIPRRLNWWHQTMDYSGEGVGKEAVSTGGLKWLSAPRPLADRNPTPSRPPCAGAPATKVASKAAKHSGAGGARRPLERCAFP